MTRSRRAFLKAGAAAAGALVLASGLASGLAQVGCKRGEEKHKLRFGVGPLLPNPEDTKKAYTPFFAHVAQQLGADFELVSTTDWAGMAVAMGSGQLDFAWMGPWGYVLANSSTGCTALATVKYDEKPIYHAIVIGRPDLNVAKFPDDTKGLAISFADVGSTSGWLIPTWYAKEVWKIDPKTFWKYSEGATHAANEMAVQSGQVDLATDFDRNRNSMVESGKVKAESSKIVWTSDPLPNDAIAAAKGTPQELIDKVQKILLAITPEQAKTLLPNHYTGFVAATHASYESVEKAGIAVGKIKPKT
jgi:phosphonate transport system substrate-binding protein